MVSIDEMYDIIEEIAATLPDGFFRELNGGVLLLEDTMLSPEAVDDDLYTMGEYCVDPLMGNYIVLYYGSFAETCRGLNFAEIKEEIRLTLIHEFTHHLETLAGEHGLELVDEEEMSNYFKSKHKKKR